MVTKVLQGLLYVSCEMYLDDCIVYASSEDQFLVRLKEVFQRFRERGLLLKAKKCEFGLLQIEYVGRVITKEELSMSKVKIQSVLNFEKLRNLHVLRSLLGLTNYFRGIVPNHSLIVKPLQDMIDDKGKKNSPLVWTQSSSDAFQAIRIAITHCPLMHFLEGTDAPIRLYTDASDYGIGGILFQIADSIWRSIAFVSNMNVYEQQPELSGYSLVHGDARAGFQNAFCPRLPKKMGRHLVLPLPQPHGTSHGLHPTANGRSSLHLRGTRYLPTRFGGRVGVDGTSP